MLTRRRKTKTEPTTKLPPKARSPQEATLDDKTKKARMLISLLGADFARSSNHPFFKRLSQTAIGTTTGVGEPNADMSGALADLLDALGKTEARPKPQKRPAAPQATPRPKARREAPARAAAVARTPEPEDPIHNQHPAIIASKLQTMPQAEKTKILRALSGRVARQVTIYAREIETKQ